MGRLVLVKRISLLFLLISASFVSTSSAGRQSMLANKLAKEVEASEATHEEITSKPTSNNEVTTIHERLLKMNTKDYGNYNPAPALVKPPFKLIPN